ncbi:hypothetical protein NBRC3255_2541 [Gluconobacter thailandicus NBRC 3255]|nr:hypothetical protein NBRC3255_2541 [Gluconobacter thailandicus NBRC 3255]
MTKERAHVTLQTKTQFVTGGTGGQVVSPTAGVVLFGRNAVFNQLLSRKDHA